MAWKRWRNKYNSFVLFYFSKNIPPMNILTKNLTISWLLVLSWYFAVTADYSSLTKNTWDTLTATNWNQLVDNVSWIQTDSSWNVGVGDFLTDSKLSIWNFSAWFNGLSIYKPNASTNRFISLNSDNISSASHWIYASWNDYGDSFVVRWDGYVWIWTNNPTKKLDVEWWGSFKNVTARDNDPIWLSIGNFHTWVQWSYIDLRSNSYTNDPWSVSIIADPLNAWESWWVIRFTHRWFWTSMIIDKDGNVWIGIDIPTEKLEVNGKIKHDMTQFNAARWVCYSELPAWNKSLTMIPLPNNTADLDSECQSINAWWNAGGVVKSNVHNGNCSGGIENDNHGWGLTSYVTESYFEAHPTLYPSCGPTNAVICCSSLFPN